MSSTTTPATKHHIELAESLVGHGLKHGAGEIEVSIDHGNRFEAEVHKGTVERLVEAGTSELQIRVLVDGKAASATSSDLSPTTLTGLVEGTIARARLGSADPFAGLPALEKVTAPAAQLQVFDPEILAMTPEQKITYARKVEKIALAQDRVADCLATRIISGEQRLSLVNSNGFQGSYQRTLVMATTLLQAGEGDNLFQDQWLGGGTSLARLPEPEELATTAAHRVTRLIGARKVKTQVVPVVVEAPVTGTLLLSFLSRCADGQAISRGQSFLVDSLGTKIASSKVSIVDDGLLAGGFATRPFDAEGVPQRRTEVISKGVLSSFLLDTYYGRKLGLGSTGNAEGPTNLCWTAGSSTPQEIISSVDQGLLLTGTIGLGTDTTTGDISIGAFGLWIEKGEPAFPVAEITISANLAEVLAGVEMVGNDLELRDAINGPTIKVAAMTIGGTGA